MPTINRPTPVDAPVSTTIIPLSQIDRAPAPVADSAPPPPVIPRSAIDRAPNPVNPTADPSVSGGGNVAPLPPVTETSVPAEATGNDSSVFINQPAYLTVDDEGSIVLDRTTILNFVGNGVVVTRSGATQATVTITHDGTGPSLGNWAFTGNTMYNLNGGLINNSDLSHGGTAHLELPVNGDSGALNLLNYYGPVTLTAGTNPGSTHTLTFDSNGVLSVVGNVVAGNVATGNVFAAGTLTANLVTGNISAPDGNGSVLFNNGGIIGAGPGFSYDLDANMLFAPGITAEGSQITGIDALYVGIGGYAILGSSVIAQLTSNVDGYSQINQQNINTGPSASGDYIITADNGTDSTYYIDLGLAGSNHADPDFFGDTTSTNDGYLYVTATDQAGPSSPAGPGNLILGSTNGVIKLFVGNTAQANVIATVASDGISVAGNIVGTGAINVGDMSIGTVPGDITANANTGITVNVSGPDGGFAVNYLDEVGNANTSGGELAFSSETGNATYRISLSDDLGDGFATKIWRFDGTGNLNLPTDGNIIIDGGDGVIGPAGDNLIISWDNENLTLRSIGDDIELQTPYSVRIETGDAGEGEYSGRWDFSSDNGKLNSLPVNPGFGYWNAGHLQFVGNSSGDNNGYTTLRLVPDDTLVGNDQYLIIDPTAPGHIHIRAGGTQDNSSADLFLGGENSYFKVNAGANNEVRISANSWPWTFGSDGTFTLPANAGLNGSKINSVANSSGDGAGYTTLQLIPDVTVGTGTDQYVILDPTAPGHIHIRAGGTQDASSADLFLGGENSYVKVTGGLNPPVYVSANSQLWTFGTDGSFQSPGDITTTGNIAVGNVIGNVGGYAIGYRDIPQVVFSANANAALTDAGKHFYSTTAGNLQLTLQDDSNIAFQTGATLTVVVNAAGNVLVNQAAGVSLYMAGSPTTGNRVVGSYGLATVMKVAANTWVINGTGVY